MRVDEPLAVDLGLSKTYARDLLYALEHAALDGEQTAITVDLPVRIHLRGVQVEQLIAKLGEITR